MLLLNIDSEALKLVTLNLSACKTCIRHSAAPNAQPASPLQRQAWPIDIHTIIMKDEMKAHACSYTISITDEQARLLPDLQMAGVYAWERMEMSCSGLERAPSLSCPFYAYKPATDRGPGNYRLLPPPRQLWTFWTSMRAFMPAFASAPRKIRSSTSSIFFRTSNRLIARK